MEVEGALLEVESALVEVDGALLEVLFVKINIHYTLRRPHNQYCRRTWCSMTVQERSKTFSIHKQLKYTCGQCTYLHMQCQSKTQS